MNIKNIIEKIENNEVLTSEEKKIYILYSVCNNHTGKMQGMISLSTSCLENPYCIARKANKKLICNKCYANTMMKRYSSLTEKLRINTIFYTTYKLDRKDIPVFTSPFFRFEAFGDIQNTTQLKNYYTIARQNKHIRFALWTKNHDIIAQIPVKPKNLIVVYSEPMLNKEWTISEFEAFQKYNPNVNKVFCVMSKDYITKNGTRINCGANNCFLCRKCYNNKMENRIIKEELK